jgi:hypothetical protein
MNKRLTKVKRQIVRSGDVFSVPIGDGCFSYGQQLDRISTCFFDLKSTTVPSVEKVLSSKPLFTIIVHISCFRNMHWKKIGKGPVAGVPELPRSYFIKEIGFKDKFSILTAGVRRPADRAECVGLERAAVWTAENVEERLRLHFSGGTWIDNIDEE